MGRFLGLLLSRAFFDAKNAKRNCKDAKRAVGIDSRCTAPAAIGIYEL